MSSASLRPDRHAEVASFLRSRRERLTPQQVGVPARLRRRVKGLRREEVAVLAGVGVTWYTWLEQGRAIAVSDRTLERIAAALRLNPSEHEYLQKLVRPHDDQLDVWSMPVEPGVRFLVENFKEGFAYVRNARFDYLAWNEKFGLFMKLEADTAGLDRNALWRIFGRADLRAMYVDWEQYAAQLVAAFRAEYAEYVGDSGFEALIEALRAASPEFTKLWTERDVLSPALWVVKAAPMRDPDSGEVVPLGFDAVHFTLPEFPGQAVIFATVARGHQ